MNDELRDQALHMLQYHQPMDSSTRLLRWKDHLAEEQLLDENDEDALVNALILEALDYLRDHGSDRNDRCTRVLVDEDTDVLFCGDCREPIKDATWQGWRTEWPEDSERIWMPCPHCQTSIMSPVNRDAIQKADRL